MKRNFFAKDLLQTFTDARCTCYSGDYCYKEHILDKIQCLVGFENDQNFYYTSPCR